MSHYVWLLDQFYPSSPMKILILIAEIALATAPITPVVIALYAKQRPSTTLLSPHQSTTLLYLISLSVAQ